MHSTACDGAVFDVSSVMKLHFLHIVCGLRFAVIELCSIEGQ